MHLIIDGYGSDPEILQSEEFIYRLLDEYPAEIGMTKISIVRRMVLIMASALIRVGGICNVLSMKLLLI